MRKIQIVPLYKIEEARKILYEYLAELSAFDPDIKFDKNGVPIYKWFDCYWTDKDRYPFYLIVENHIAGLAMIRELSYMRYDFAEFYVRPEFRKDGNALWFATEVANLFDGEFVFSTRFTNPRAIKFWGKFANQFELNSFTDDDIWRNWTIRKNHFTTHNLNLQPIYFDLIKKQEKTLEGRLNDEKRRSFNIGDIITFHKEPAKTETLDAVILDKYVFKNFDEMAQRLNKSDLGFADKTQEEMKSVYRKFYSRQDEEKCGVVVFKIKTLQ